MNQKLFMKHSHLRPSCKTLPRTFQASLRLVLSLLLLAVTSLPAFATCIGCGGRGPKLPCPAPGTITYNSGYWYYGNNVQAYSVTYYLGGCTLGQYFTSAASPPAVSALASTPSPLLEMISCTRRSGNSMNNSMHLNGLYYCGFPGGFGNRV